MTIALTTARYGFETVPPIPPRKVAERTDYGRIVELLASGKAGAVQAAPELRGWLNGERPPAPADWQRARRVIAALDMLFRIARSVE